MTKIAKFSAAIFFIASVFTVHLFANGNFWNSTNGPFGGRIRDLKVNSAGHIYAAISDNGVFRSTDHGETWEPMNNGLDILQTICLLIAANDDIFCGTNNGLFISHDQGASWQLVAGTGYGAVVVTLEMMPGNLLFAGTNTGVWRSADYGATWLEKNTGLSFQSVSAMAKIDDNTLFVGVDYGNLFKSTDNGDSWQKITGEFGGYDFRAIMAGPTGAIFAGNQSGIYRTTDGGATWTSLLYNNNPITGYALFFDSNNNLFAGSYASVLRSNDNGDGWSPVNTPPLGKNFSAFAEIPGGYLFTGGDNGVIRSLDAGSNWKDANEKLTGVSVNSVAMDGDHILYAASEFNGLFRLSQPGLPWEAINNGLPTATVSDILSTSNGELLVTTDGLGVFRSTDQGANWTDANNGFSNNWVGYAVIAENHAGVLFCSNGEGLWRSSDNAQSWQKLASSNTDIGCLKFSSTDEIFAGTQSSGLLRSNDDGASWNTFTNGIEFLSINDVLLDEVGQLIYAATSSGLYKMPMSGSQWQLIGFESNVVPAIAFNTQGDLIGGSAIHGEMLSKDGGATWEPLNDGLGHVTVLTLLKEDGGELIAGTTGGVYVTDFTGAAGQIYAPQIISVTDIPADQGGKVTVKWLASSLDKDFGIEYYSIWRALPDESNQFPDGWEWIADMPAHGFEVYSFTATTLYDSTKGIDGKHFFMVSAHASGDFYDSNFADGYSVDNLAPAPPQNLAAKVENQTVVLNWNANTEFDLKEYHIFSSNTPAFNFAQMQPLAVTADTSFAHVNPPAGEKIYYTVLAVDVHGNLSTPGEQVSAEITTRVAESVTGLPQQYRLFQNHPNPFNPATNITFEVPQRGFVTLRIIDQLGREVTTLHSGVLAAGRYSETWSAVNQPSGVYFYRLTVRNETETGKPYFSQTKKMLLMK